MQALHAITSLVGGLLLLALVISGLVMMFSPTHGRRMLKDALIALGLFVLASMLVQAVYGSYCVGR